MSTYVKVRNYLLNYTVMDKYNVNGACYTISNLYYDTPYNSLIRNSVAKPKYKEKLRLRAYGVPDLNDKVFLEIKKKFRGTVNKRRTVLTLGEAYNFLESHTVPNYKDYMNRQVLNELEYFLKTYNVQPKVYIAYDRIALFDNTDSGVRISFDTNIRARRCDLRLEAGDCGKLIMNNKDMWIMETKVEQSMPLWLTEMLSDYNIKKQSFSKYGSEYKLYIAENIKRSDTICSSSYLHKAANPSYRPAVQY